MSGTLGKVWTVTKKLFGFGVGKPYITNLFSYYDRETKTMQERDGREMVYT